ncbi:hypothetical protein C8Q73DRAFT_481849 [Cubamyces lactineus]|nr:hypothetical protein C8Q73DRAFT_481849 [Cubamyces lactineus]
MPSARRSRGGLARPLSFSWALCPSSHCPLPPLPPLLSEHLDHVPQARASPALYASAAWLELPPPSHSTLRLFSRSPVRPFSPINLPAATGRDLGSQGPSLRRPIGDRVCTYWTYVRAPPFHRSPIPPSPRRPATERREARFEHGGPRTRVSSAPSAERNWCVSGLGAPPPRGRGEQASRLYARGVTTCYDIGQGQLHDSCRSYGLGCSLDVKFLGPSGRVPESKVGSARRVGMRVAPRQHASTSTPAWADALLPMWPTSTSMLMSISITVGDWDSWL